MVYRDPLTGAYNRQMFQQRIAREFAHSRRHNLPLALLMIDVDHFKKVNDTYGHLVGDQVLKEISELLRTTVRTDDYVARFGGEEFVVIASRLHPGNSNYPCRTPSYHNRGASFLHRANEIKRTDNQHRRCQSRSNNPHRRRPDPHCRQRPLYRQGLWPQPGLHH